ncbi:hypothetical protein MMC08_008920 [Hypocenomyce scalaris]|nr:hypothetical protein [Hypocenomyce scalaris]
MDVPCTQVEVVQEKSEHTKPDARSISQDFKSPEGRDVLHLRQTGSQEQVKSSTLAGLQSSRTYIRARSCHDPRALSPTCNSKPVTDVSPGSAESPGSSISSIKHEDYGFWDTPAPTTLQGPCLATPLTPPSASDHYQTHRVYEDRGQAPLEGRQQRLILTSREGRFVEDFSDGGQSPVEEMKKRLVWTSRPRVSSKTSSNARDKNSSNNTAAALPADPFSTTTTSEWHNGGDVGRMKIAHGSNVNNQTNVEAPSSDVHVLQLSPTRRSKCIAQAFGPLIDGQEKAQAAPPKSIRRLTNEGVLTANAGKVEVKQEQQSSFSILNIPNTVRHCAPNAINGDDKALGQAITAREDLRSTPIISTASTATSIPAFASVVKTYFLNPIFRSEEKEKFDKGWEVCIAYCKRKPRRRCTRQLAENNQIEVDTILQQLPNATDAEVEGLLTRFVELAYCGRSHRDETLARLKTWISAIAVTQELDSKLAAVSLDDHVECLSTFINPTFSKESTTTAVYKQGRTRSQRNGITCVSTSFIGVSTKPAPRMNRTKHAPFSNALPIPRMESLCYKKYAGLSGEAILKKALIRTFTPRELHRGFIYVFWAKGTFGMVKIGKTTNIQRRLQDWQNQCKHPLELIYPRSLEEAVEVSHVYRVEALIHAELYQYRKQCKICPGCGKNHTEWFETRHPEHVEAVVKKWSLWIEQDPYEEVMIYKRTSDDEEWEDQVSTWRLSDNNKRQIEDLCRPWDGLKPAKTRPPLRDRARSSSSSGKNRTTSTKSRRRSSRLAKRNQISTGVS